MSCPALVYPPPLLVICSQPAAVSTVPWWDGQMRADQGRVRNGVNASDHHPISFDLQNRNAGRKSGRMAGKNKMESMPYSGRRVLGLRL